MTEEVKLTRWQKAKLRKENEAEILRRIARLEGERDGLVAGLNALRALKAAEEARLAARQPAPES